jgi:hypothetical protein
MLIFPDMDQTTQQLMSDDAYLHQLPKLTRQQKAFVHSYSHLHNVQVACQSAGISRSTGHKWLKEKDISENLDFYEQEALVEVKLTRSQLTNMLLESHRKSATAMEEIAAVREIGKMNGLYEPEKTVNVNANYTKVEQLESLSDEELLKMAGSDDLVLDPA